MPRPTFADPRTSHTFMRIFGSRERKDILVAFLDDMLALDEPHRIVTVELLSPEQRPRVAELELAIVNVKCTDARDVTYVVEMQVLQVEGFDKRVVDNVDKAYVNQTARRGQYPGLDDVVGITICDFELWPDNGEHKIPMLSRWSTAEQQTGSNEPGQIQLVFLELPKYDTTRPPQTAIEKWAYFFREADKLHGAPEALARRPFIDALEAARLAAFTVAEWDAYILAGMAIQNKRGALAAAEKRGREQALKAAHESGLRAGVEALCGVLGVELTEERRRQLTGLDAAGLSSLLAHLQDKKAWR